MAIIWILVRFLEPQHRMDSIMSGMSVIDYSTDRVLFILIYDEYGQCTYVITWIAISKTVETLKEARDCLYLVE